jgi:hypothetical protein
VTRNIFQAIAILFLSAAALMAAPAERWIHVRVESARGVSGNVSINVPIEMASAALPLIPADHQHHGKFGLQASVNGMDLRAMLDAVRNSPDNVFVTLERHDKEVSVAKSGRNLLIKIVEKPSAEHHLGKTIAIKVPIPVVRAMLANNSDEVDIGAGIRALTREGDVDVTVNSEKETVRVWTDTRTTSD